jgi:hypothetical protein
MDMRRNIIQEWMQEALDGVRLPKVALEFVAGMATVHPVCWFIQAAQRAWLEVVDG